MTAKRQSYKSANAANRKARVSRRASAEEAQLRPIPNKNLNRLTWDHWKRDAIALLGFQPKVHGVTDEQHLFGELGVNRDEAVSAYNAGLNPVSFVGQHPHYLAAPRHDHTNGSVNCPLCTAEKTAEREGNIPYDQWCRQLLDALGHKPSWNHVYDEQWLARIGVDLKDATDYWARNFTAGAYARIRQLHKLPDQRATVRLFDDVTEACTPMGQQVSMHVRRVAKEAVEFVLAEDPNASLRDLEHLFVSSVQAEIARAIVIRRRTR